MVQSVDDPRTRTRLTMTEAGAALAEAKRKWSEAFLLHKLADPKRTDNVARAMADQDVDLAGAEVDWVLAQARHDVAKQEFEIRRINLLMEGDDATQSTKARN